VRLVGIDGAGHINHRRESMHPTIHDPRSKVRRRLGLALMTAMALTVAACGGGTDTGTLSITSQPANRTVNDGANASFSVVAAGEAPLNYQWRKNGGNVPGGTASTLVVTAPYADNGAAYSVVVGDASGSVTSASATLTVTPLPPSITAQPQSISVATGAPATFSVVTSGGTGPVLYQWRRGGVDIAGATAASYSITATTLADHGALFSVAIVSPSGTQISSTATLAVADGAPIPLITAQPQNQSVAYGSTATFSVVASSGSAMTYQWSRGGVAIGGATGASYTTPATTAGDNGAVFTVTVSNAAGPTNSAAATLTVTGVPQIAVQQVAAGTYHSAAMKNDGSVWSWGYTGYGLMGVGSDPVSAGVPIRAKNGDGTPFTGAAGISAGASHTMVVKGDGTLWGWGLNAYGSLGDGSSTLRSSPVQVKDAAGIPFTGATQVAAGGGTYTLAVKADGSAWAWGYNGYGTLGDGTTTNRANPVPVLAPGGAPFTGVSKVAAGHYHSLALKTDGTVYAWGYNNYGQLGDGSTGNRTAPGRVDVTPGVALSNIVAIAAGDAHSAAVTAAGTAYAWGYNVRGSLGDGTTSNRSRPAVVKDVAGNALTGIIGVSAGVQYTMFLKSDGTVWATGYNNVGQLGDNTATAFQINPVVVKDAAGTTFGGVVGLALTAQHTVVMRSDGTVWAWGDNGYRQLGDTSTTDRRNPVQALLSGS
jgi:alpha-tubulin suppressor-like RCC1 family protein